MVGAAGLEFLGAEFVFRRHQHVERLELLVDEGFVLAALRQGPVVFPVFHCQQESVGPQLGMQGNALRLEANGIVRRQLAQQAVPVHDQRRQRPGVGEVLDRCVQGSGNLVPAALEQRHEARLFGLVLEHALQAIDPVEQDGKEFVGVNRAWTADQGGDETIHAFQRQRHVAALVEEVDKVGQLVDLVLAERRVGGLGWLGCGHGVGLDSRLAEQRFA